MFIHFIARTIIVNDDQRLHFDATALSGSSTNQLELDFSDPKDLFSYKTVLGSNSSEKAIVGEKRKFSALSPAEINSSFLSASQVSRDLRTIIGSTGRPSLRAIEHYDTYLSLLPTRRSSPETVNAEFFSSENYFTNARADHRKRMVPTVEECNSSVMDFALGLMWDSNDLSTQWQSSSTSSSFHVASSVCGGLYSESTAEEHGSDPDLFVKQTPIISADNSSMDLLASVATGIIEVSPNLMSAAEVIDQFREKQRQQTRLHHQLSDIEKRRKLAVDYADKLSYCVACIAGIYDAATRKAYEAREAFDRATEVASEACAEAHRIQGNNFDLSKSFVLGQGEMMLLRDHRSSRAQGSNGVTLVCYYTFFFHKYILGNVIVLQFNLLCITK